MESSSILFHSMNISNILTSLHNFTRHFLPNSRNSIEDKPSSITDLPDELLRDIFSLLSRRDLNSIQLSTRRFYSTVHAKPAIRTKRRIDQIAIARTDVDETRIVVICVEEGKTLVSSYSDYFRVRTGNNCLKSIVKRALRMSHRVHSINELPQGRKYLENVLAASRQRMESINKSIHEVHLLAREAIGQLQTVCKGGFVDRLTFHEMSMDGDFLRSMYNCVRVNTRVNTIEMVNCDISRVSRQHFHEFLVSFEPIEISITLNSEQLDLNRQEFWTYSFFHKCMQNGVQKLILTPHRSVRIPQPINGLDDSNFANLSAFRQLEIRQVGVSGVGIRRLVEAYLHSESSRSISVFILTISNFSLDPLLPHFDFHSTQSPPLLPPDSTIPDSTFYFNSPTQTVRVRIEFNGRFVTMRSIPREYPYW